MQVVPGAQLGQYRIVEQVGRGGMATVYKAFQPALNRYVAVKVLPAFYAEDPQFLERFRQEAQTVSQLRHPNILAVFDFGEQDGVTFMVSEFLSGGTLEQLLGGPLPPERVVELLRPVAAALDYAHARGTIHRDVKPSNVMLTEDGTPVLTDFGLARIVSGSTRLTATGVSVGTPEYMAPEQAAGESTTAASDRYALGIVLYEMLTGRTPFQAETPIAVALAHLHKPLPLPRTLNPELLEGAERVLLKALAKAPEERFDSCLAMIAALTDAASESTAPAAVPEGSPAPPTSAPSPGAAAVSSEPRPAAASVAAVATTPPPEMPTGRAASAAGVPVPGVRRGPLPLLLGAVGLLAVVGLLALMFLRPAAAPTSDQAGTAAPAGPKGTAAPAKPGAGPAAKSGRPKGERAPLDRLIPQLAARLGAVVERDDFTDPAAGLFPVPLDSSLGRAYYENGSLVMEYTRRSSADALAITLLANRPTSFGNGVVDVDAHVSGEGDLGGVSLGFRRPTGVGDGYTVWFRPRPKLVQILRWQGANFATLAQAQVDGIDPDDSNRLTLVADGPVVQLYVNGRQALEVRDETYPSGRIGLAAGLPSNAPSGSTRAAFSDFRVISLR
jgi:hypothetical protein